MAESTSSFFDLLKEKYPELHKVADRIILQSGYQSNMDWRKIYPHIPESIARQYATNALLRLPYSLLDPDFRRLLSSLSLASGYLVFASDIGRATCSDTYKNKPWVPHGAHESCIYSICYKYGHAKEYNNILFVIYGTMKTVSVVVMSLAVDIHGEIRQCSVDPSLTFVSGGLILDDIVRRCLKSFQKTLHCGPDDLSSLTSNLCLVALQEPNFGHHQWNIFTSLLDIIPHLDKKTPSEGERSTLHTLAFDQLTNYLALDTIAASSGIHPICNENYSLLEHGFLMPLDAPVPVHNSTLILNSIIPVRKANQKSGCIVVVIKGFNSKYNQNQIDKTLAQLILLHVVRFLLENQNKEIVIDGVTRSSSSSINKKDTEAFSRFLNEENQMYEKLIQDLPGVFRQRVSSMIGMSIEHKYPTYIKTIFSVSISAHSTLMISLMAGKPVVDILRRSLLESVIKTSLYYHARNSDPDAYAFISFDESAAEQRIIDDILSGLSSYMVDPKTFHKNNSIWSYYRKDYT